jgi:hypothetical protein
MRLGNHVAALFNAVREKQPSRIKSGLHPMNNLLLVDSGEVFGLVSSPHTTSYGGLLEISKDEPILDLEMDLFLQEIDARTAEMDWQPIASVQSNTSTALPVSQGTGDSDGNPGPLAVASHDVVQGITGTEVKEPRSGDTSSLRKGKRKALEILDIDPTLSQSHGPLNVSESALTDKRRRLDQPHLLHDNVSDVPTVNDSESGTIMSWLHSDNGDNLPVCNHIRSCSNSS